MGCFSFKKYHPHTRYKSLFSGRIRDAHYAYYHKVLDLDQRRVIRVQTAEKRDEDFIFEALERRLDVIGEDLVSIIVSEDDLELLSWSRNEKDDIALIPFYPSPSDFPAGLPKVRRSQLTEIDRLAAQTDHTTYEPSPGHGPKHVVFKYYITEGNIVSFWHELNCTLRIPNHLNIVPLDCLVIDSATPGGPDKVVGFTTPFIAGGTVWDNVSRTFTLAHLNQLTKTIDYLNLQLGIVHGTINSANLLIDPETDQLKIFNFSWGAKLGWEGDKDHEGAVYRYDEHRNDIKMAVFAVYEIITRDLSFGPGNDASMVLEKETWEKAAEVRLEEGVDVAEYRRVLDEWVALRKPLDAVYTHYTQTPQHIDWPSVPEFPLTESRGTIARHRALWRSELTKRGEPFIKWQRPPTAELPLSRGKRLLATGEIVDEDPQFQSMISPVPYEYRWK
ncbi:hypothetical protein F5144DRAFT_507470 [Chaetomium tenue]|uniref:Uncharacterized protein n=1 Tax=Chaetomium tenue TaxID=1854479 RepID=A0ACB7PLK8_9PEZI|nr:hypothetical protein F5144DRAFT_507470 [Chaetomium globosum]